MSADHFTALVRQHRNGRTDRQIAAEAGIPQHWLSIYLKPSTSIKTMPDEGRVAALARAIGCTEREVRKAFAEDIVGYSPDDGIAPDGDPQTDKMLRLWAGLDTPHRVTGISMLQSLATLQRRTTAIEGHDEREVG